MNTTQITLKGKVVNLRFGNWVMEQLIYEGYNVNSLQGEISANPFKFFAKLMHLGAVNATESKSLDEYSINEFHDWIDDVGGVGSDECAKVINCFTFTLTGGKPEKKPVAKVSKKK